MHHPLDRTISYDANLYFTKDVFGARFGEVVPLDGGFEVNLGLFYSAGVRQLLLLWPWGFNLWIQAERDDLAALHWICDLCVLQEGRLLYLIGTRIGQNGSQGLIEPSRLIVRYQSRPLCRESQTAFPQIQPDPWSIGVLDSAVTGK